MTASARSNTLSEIEEVNLSYLLLAQRLLREDRTAGMRRMGLSEPLADVLVGLSLAQTARLAASNQVLCRFRLDDHAILSALVDKGKSAAAKARAAITLSTPPAGQAG